MNGSPDRDVEVFTETLLLPAGQRAAYLDRACGGDAELRQKVEALLRGHDDVGDFLEHSPHETTAQGKLGSPIGEKPGDRVGRYKLLQQIGEGGCGVVFMAEQEQPVRRRVALKIIKPGMDTKIVIARFEAEGQALALMDHPNIAKIFDAGATESGRPYFVMELVRGVKITEYCDQHSLVTEERLKLFVQVCEAIQHAHQKGIIHRDIKPSNILVTSTLEGATLPVVIDFGIAKATTNQRLTDKTIFTAFEMLIGTPAYMSPEQAELTSVDVDTRTDIYSLGVLLYELLTGSTPFDTGELLKSGLDEIRRVIREREPIRPSTRLSNLSDADLTTVAQYRHSDPPTLIRGIRGDLDWIAMKALEKDRTRRYETAHGLALDVQRYLSDEIISARPPSKLYQLKKAFLRNRILFTGIGVIALLLVLSLIVVSESLATERQARREAETASVKSRQVTKFLKEMMSGAGTIAARGLDTTLLREILDGTAKRLGTEMADQPAEEAELRGLIGKIYEESGKFAQAEDMERTALAINQRVFGPESLEAAQSLNDLGLEFMAQHKLPEAEKAHGEALAIRRKLLGQENTNTATSLNDLAAVYRDEGKLAEAERMAQEALGVRRKLFGPEHVDVADSLRNLTIIFGSEGRWAEAKKTGEEALAMRRKVLGPNHPYIPSSLEDLAWAESGLGEYDEAEKLDDEVLDLRQKLLGDSHPDVGRTLNALGQLLGNRRDLPASEAVLKATLSIQRKLLGDDNRATLESFEALAGVLGSENKTNEAESVLREALGVLDKQGDDANPRRVNILRGLCDTLEREGRWQEAEPMWREALPLWRRLRGVEDRESMYALRRLGLTLEAEHKWPEAESVHREALSISRKKGDEDPEAFADLEKLVRVLTNQKKYAEAKELLDRALTPAFVTQGASANLLNQRANLLGRRGRWKEAAALAAIALEKEPEDHYQYHTLAGLLVVTQDRPAYEQLCKKLTARFSNPVNPYIAERVAQDCLLLPNSGVDLAWIDKLADVAVTRGSGEAALPYFQTCKAMSNYRLGRFSEAVEWAEKTVNNPIAEAPAKGKAFAVLAMARWQLGQEQAARAALAAGNAAAPKFSPEHDDLGESWVAWLVARISLDEAGALIQSGSTPGSQSKQP
jgi:eukaryotic-like serine/threonine-protein kinase